MSSLSHHHTTKQQQRPSSNSLTKLLPGYTAPFTLTSKKSLDAIRVPGGLEGLRKRALQDEYNAAIQTASSSGKKKSNNSYYNVSVSFSAFKKGPKKKKKRSSDDIDIDGWFGMKPSAMTDEVKKDLALIRNRNYLDPKRFYKKADVVGGGNGSMVQVGTVVEGPTEYYSSRLTKKQRRTNLVDEVLADDKLSKYANRKYTNMQQEKKEKEKQYKRRAKKNSNGQRRGAGDGGDGGGRRKKNDPYMDRY